jgi:hypothetical protein
MQLKIHVMKTITTEIIIMASPEKVWDILLNFSEYPEWNPFIRELTGTPETGKKLKVSIELEGRNPMVFKPIVLSFIPGEKFCWRGILFLKGLFDGTHFFKLEPMEDGNTRFIHGENFSGVLAGTILNKIEASTRAGFERMNKALKAQAES